MFRKKQKRIFTTPNLLWPHVLQSYQKDHIILSPLTTKNNKKDLFQPKSLSSDKQRDVFICIKSKTTSGKFVRTRWTTCHIYTFENHKFALYKESKFYSCKLFLSYKIWLETTCNMLF